MSSQDDKTLELVAAAIELLEEHGPHLGRLLVDTLHGSRLRNLKELSPASSGRSEIRMLFIFDPRRNAIMLVAVDKAGDWHRWYKKNIPRAEEIYEQHLQGIEGDDNPHG